MNPLDLNALPGMPEMPASLTEAVEELKARLAKVESSDAGQATDISNMKLEIAAMHIEMKDALSFYRTSILEVNKKLVPPLKDIKVWLGVVQLIAIAIYAAVTGDWSGFGTLG